MLRHLKNHLICRKWAVNTAVRTVNLPVIGKVYDYFYFKQIQKKINSQKFSLWIEPNNICNLKCEMCCYQDMKRKKTSMPMELFKKIIRQAKALGCKEVCLTQYNEPLTDRNLFERINYVKKIGLSTSFYSNGTLLTAEMREKILANPPDLIRFSFDGASKNTYESIRKGANYEKVLNGIASLYNERNKQGLSKPGIEVYFTIFDRNKDEAKPFLKFWKDKCDFASVYPADSRQDGKFSFVNFTNKKFYPCYNPKNLFVHSDGKVVPCCVDINGLYELGDLNKQTLKEILKSKKVKNLYNKHSKGQPFLTMCKNCSKGHIDQAFIWWI